VTATPAPESPRAVDRAIQEHYSVPPTLQERLRAGVTENTEETVIGLMREAAARIDSLEAQLADERRAVQSADETTDEQYAEAKAWETEATHLRGLVATAHRIVSTRQGWYDEDAKAGMADPTFVRGWEFALQRVLDNFAGAGITGEPAAPERKDPTR
jgi:hypothetical protein